MRLCDEFGTDRQPRCETHDRDADTIRDKRMDRSVNVAWIRREKGAVHDDSFFGSVGRGCREHASSEFQTVLKARIAFHFDLGNVTRFPLRVGFGTEFVERAEMRAGAAGEVGEALGEAVSRDDDRELRDGVLTKELMYE